MKLNVGVRARNPLFWVQVALALVVPLMGYFGMSAEQLTSWAALGSLVADAAKNPYVLTMAAVSVWNAVNDPTTKGMGDSAMAMKHKKPAA